MDITNALEHLNNLNSVVAKESTNNAYHPTIEVYSILYNPTSKHIKPFLSIDIADLDNCSLNLKYINLNHQPSLSDLRKVMKIINHLERTPLEKRLNNRKYRALFEGAIIGRERHTDRFQLYSEDEAVEILQYGTANVQLEFTKDELEKVSNWKAINAEYIKFDPVYDD